MALRFVRTIDVSPHMFSTREHADTDWLLYCGAWQVGRLHEESRPAGRVAFVWSLTGPLTPEAPGRKRGEAASVADAKQELVAAMRAWAIWAGLRTRDGGGPVAPTWAQDGEDWRLFSGGFLAGRVRRPTTGPCRDPHWMLLGMSPRTPGPRAGWADSIDAAKDALLRAWEEWLAWAELNHPEQQPSA